MKNFKKFTLIIFVLAITILPTLVFAQSPPTPIRVCSATISDVGDIICKVGSILNLIIPFLITLGVVYFVWGVVQYVIADDEEAKKSGKNRIIYGLIGFVVIFSMWGLVGIVINTFGFDQQGSNLVSNFIQSNSSIGQANSLTCALGSNPKIGTLLNYATCLINKSVIPLLFSLAVVMFIWGVIQYVINSDEEAKREKGKQFMIWGIIGLTVMIGVWGLVRIVGTTFGIEYAIPQLQTTGK